MYNIAILASGSGTNAENIIRTFQNGDLLRVKLIMTDQPDAGVIERVRPFGIPTIYIPGPTWRKNPQEIIDILRRNHIDLVILAGFMRLIAEPIVNAYPHRILNIHPALLPAYGGKGMWGHHVHQAVIDARETKSGVTVHYVDAQYDHGQTILQETVDITPDDTPETLEQKIHTLEYSIYPRAIVKAITTLDNATPPPLPPRQDTIPAHTEITPGTEPASESPASAPIDPSDTVERQWAQTLHIDYNPAPQTPPPHPVCATTPTPPGPNQNDRENPPMPPSYFALSIIITLLCCLVPGIIAIIYSSRVSNLYYQGDIEASKRASDNAQLWIIISFCLGILSATLYIPYMIATSALGIN